MGLTIQRVPPTTVRMTRVASVKTIPARIEAIEATLRTPNNKVQSERSTPKSSISAPRIGMVHQVVGDPSQTSRKRRNQRADRLSSQWMWKQAMKSLMTPTSSIQVMEEQVAGPLLTILQKGTRLPETKTNIQNQTQTRLKSFSSASAKSKNCRPNYKICHTFQSEADREIQARVVCFYSANSSSSSQTIFKE